MNKDEGNNLKINFFKKKIKKGKRKRERRTGLPWRMTDNPSGDLREREREELKGE